MKRFEAELIARQWHDGAARKEDVEALLLYYRKYLRGRLSWAENWLKIGWPHDPRWPSLEAITGPRWNSFPETIDTAKKMCGAIGRADPMPYRRA
jgi:hypothetical protein